MADGFSDEGVATYVVGGDVGKPTIHQAGGQSSPPRSPGASPRATATGSLGGSPRGSTKSASATSKKVTQHDDDDEESKDEFGSDINPFGEDQDGGWTGADDGDIQYDEGEEEEDEEESASAGEMASSVSEEASSSCEAGEISEVSNETDLGSDFVPVDLERQPAQLIPDPPWDNICEQLWQLACSCLLPVFLVLLCAYALLKFVKVTFQCLYDIVTVLAKVTVLLIKIALSPLLLVWLLFFPAYVRAYMTRRFDERFGARLRLLLRVKWRVVRFVFDIPDIIVACGIAGVDTFLIPARDSCRKGCWQRFGRHVHKWILKPMHDKHINRLANHRKKSAMTKGRELQMARMKSQRLARKRAREIKERQRNLRNKMKPEEHEVVLNLEAGDDEKHEPAVVVETIVQKPPTEMFSRTMIVERRYAVGVGCFWCSVGICMLTIVINGSSGERCTICHDNPDIGMRVCRHGLGRDCAFHLHSDAVIISVAVLTLGMVLLIYATLMYKPRDRQEIARRLKEKEKEKEAKEMNQIQQAHQSKIDDAETPVKELLHAYQKRNTIPRIVRGMYRRSCWSSIPQTLSFLLHRPLAALMRWEDKRELKLRSVSVQEAMLSRLWPLLWMLGLSEKREDSPAVQHISTGGPGDVIHAFSSEKFTRIRSTRVGRCLSFVGLGLLRSLCGRCGKGYSDGMKGRLGDQKLKKASSNIGRASATLEDALRAFGFDKEIEEEEEKAEALRETQRASMSPTVNVKRDAGDLETQRAVNTSAQLDAQLDEELAFQGRDWDVEEDEDAGVLDDDVHEDERDIDGDEGEEEEEVEGEESSASVGKDDEEEEEEEEEAEEYQETNSES